MALEGRNGSGKSSLLKLICGGDVDFTGRFSIGSGLKISYVPQDASFCGASWMNMRANAAWIRPF